MKWLWWSYGGGIARFPVAALIWMMVATLLFAFGRDLPTQLFAILFGGSFLILRLWMVISIARSGMQSPEPHWTIRLWSIFDRRRYPDENRDPELR